MSEIYFGKNSDRHFMYKQQRKENENENQMRNAKRDGKKKNVNEYQSMSV